MSKSLYLGLTVGAVLSKSVGTAFATLDKQIGDTSRNLKKLRLGSAAADDLQKYKSELLKLQVARKEGTHDSELLGKQIDKVRKKYEAAKKKAAQYGITVGNVAAEQARLSKEIAKTSSRLNRQQTYMRNRDKRSELRGQFMGTVGMVVAAAAPIRAAMEFESVMADIGKVVDFDSPEGFKAMGKDILKMSTRIPMTAEGIGEIVASAGQAGIAREELSRFAEDASKMGIAFDMAGREAGSAMTGMRSIFALNQDQVVSLGDAYNHLSNNMDATARDMLQIANRAGSTAQLFGLSGEQVGALGATFLALKTKPEVAATGINALLMRLKTADKQSEKFQSALDSLGYSASGMKEAIEEDAQGALLGFLETVKDSDDVMGTLADMFGAEYSDDIAKLVGGLNHYRKALGLVADETSYAGSMQEEYEKRSKTTANSLQLFRSQATRLAITLGSVLLPPINWTLSKLGELADGAVWLAEKFPRVTTALVGVAVGLIGMKAAMLVSSFVGTGLSDVFTLLRLNAVLATGKTWLLTAAQWAWNVALNANPIGLIVAGVAALAAGAFLVIKYWEPVKAFFVDLWGSVKSIGSAIGSFFGFGSDEGPALKPIAKKAGAALVGATMAAAPAAATISPAQANYATLPANASAPSSSSAQDNRQYTINVTSSPGMDERALAEQVQREITRMDEDKAARRRGALHDG